MIPEMTAESLAATTSARSFAIPRDQWRPRRWLSARWGQIGVAGLMVTGIVLSLSAAQTPRLLPDSVRPVPGWLAGVFGHIGINLHLGGMIVVLGLMFLSYVVAMRSAEHLSARAVLIGVAGLHAVMLLGPPLLSTDIFSYIAYGRIGAIYGANPYLHGPSAIPLDYVYPFVGWQWVTTPTTYGPLFTAISYAFAHVGIAANVVAYKAIAAVSSLVIVVVVWKAARLRGVNPVKAVALVGLNPVIVVFGVGGGHNDLLMLAILVTAVYVLLLGRERTSGALIVAATAVKLTAGVLLPFALAESGGHRDGPRRRQAVLTGFGITAALAAVFSFALFGTGTLHLLQNIQDAQDQGGPHSLSGLVLAGLGLGRFTGAVNLVLDACFFVWLVWLVRRVWRGELDWIRGAGWATVGLLVTAGLLQPWYVAWLVPLAALSRDRRLLATAIFMTGVGLTTL